MEKCIECDANDEVASKECVVAWGICNHVIYYDNNSLGIPLSLYRKMVKK
jgi:hypothetical protein